MMYRSLRVSTPPAVEPVSLSDAKAHCRVDGTSDDAYITALISAAREWAEVYMDEALIHQRLAMRLDFFPVEIILPRPPVVTPSVGMPLVITYTPDSSMQTAVLQAAGYRVDSDAAPGVIRPPYGGSWPSHLSDFNSILVTWWAGRSNSGAGVPHGVKNALLMLVGHWYERRLAAESGSLNEIPYGVKSLLDCHRWGSYT